MTLYIMVVGKLPIYNPDIVMFFDDLMEKEIEYPASLSAPLVYPCRPSADGRCWSRIEALTRRTCFGSSSAAIR